jgi:hypothetical protein
VPASLAMPAVESEHDVAANMGSVATMKLSQRRRVAFIVMECPQAY